MNYSQIISLIDEYKKTGNADVFKRIPLEERAKEVRKFVDKMISYGKKESLVSRRKALAFLNNDSELVKKLFNEIAPKYSDRNGGYTKIIKLKERRGDDALIVRLELVK